MLTYGSACSGAGGFDLGFHRAGLRCLWQCEIDPYRQRVLAKHWPDVLRLPDLAALNPAELQRPRILIGGTPCQDLSVAGLQAGLDGERSGLFFDYMRVRNHLGIEWCVWENVAGALSSNNGLDFAQVLAAMVGADVPVPAAGWAGAGVAAGPWGGCVWRVLDAQHFGVPQRRRRVFVVGRLGAACPPEVLLESQGSGGHPAPRGEAGARVAAPLTRGSARPGVSDPGRRQEDDINIVATLPARGSTGGFDVDPAMAAGGHLIAGALTAPRSGAGGSYRLDAHDVDSNHLIAHTPRAEGFDASEDGTGRGTPLVCAEPAARGPRDTDGREPEDERRQARAGLRGGQDGVDGAAPDADGVRAADGLAGRVDDPMNPLPDGRRYAACGDGVVAPVAEWIARRLAAVIEAERTEAA